MTKQIQNADGVWVSEKIANLQKFQKGKTYKAIMAIVKKHRLVADRVAELEGEGYSVETYPMGSGGTGNVHFMSDHIRVQIGYGVGKHNYAKAVRLPLPQ